MKFLTKTVGMMLLCFMAAPNLHATLIYDEDVSGDFSDDNLAPTELSVVLGSNIVAGSTSVSPFDRDLFTFTIAAGQELAALVLDVFSASDNRAFLAVATGETIASLDSPVALLGNALVGVDPGSAQGDDLLDDMGDLTFAGSTGFSGPLAAGTYTFWIQETSVGIERYALDFQLRDAQVPVPAPALLMLSALWLLHRRARGRGINPSG